MFGAKRLSGLQVVWLSPPLELLLCPPGAGDRSGQRVPAKVELGEHVELDDSHAESALG